MNNKLQKWQHPGGKLPTLGARDSAVFKEMKALNPLNRI